MGEVSVVIPARNEEKTVYDVVNELKRAPLIREVIVVDNGSSDQTAAKSREAGARVLSCARSGLGNAMKCGIAEASCDLIMKIDGDIRNPRGDWVEQLYAALGRQRLFANGYYVSDYDEFPLGTLTARPALKLFFPELDYVRIPLSGTYIYRSDRISVSELPAGWAFDLALLLKAHGMGSEIGQADLGSLNDTRKRITDYAEPAIEILRYAVEAGLERRHECSTAAQRQFRRTKTEPTD